MSEAADQELLGELRALHDVLDPLPEVVLTAACAAFEWRDVEAELAELRSDRRAAELGMRSTADARLLGFTGRRGGAEVEVLEVGGRRRLVGQLLPICAGLVTATVRGSSFEAVADEVGCFRFDDLPDGPLRLRWIAAAGPVVTRWVVI
ncbi:MAG TPA: hypothetical protein VHV82_05135 [Sporichthyaceae bacterium]|jgi:hypothetical protein|nr:hypothetical protein [Sporichthyaceae bacterium]